MALSKNGEVKLRCYKGSVGVLSRSSESEKLYDSELASMDAMDDFSPMDTSTYLFHAPTPDFQILLTHFLLQLDSSKLMPSDSRSMDCRRPRRGRVWTKLRWSK